MTRNYSYYLLDIVGLIDYYEDALSKGTNIERARSVLASYSEVRPLSEDEKWHLYDVLKLMILIDSLWYIERGEYPNFKEKMKIDDLERLGRKNFYANLFENGIQ